MNLLAKHVNNKIFVKNVLIYTHCLKDNVFYAILQDVQVVLKKTNAISVKNIIIYKIILVF